MKEQPRQFLARLLADWKHVSEIFRKNQDRYVQRANKNIKAHRFHVGGHPRCPSATQVPIHPRRRTVCVCVGECGSRAPPT